MPKLSIFIAISLDGYIARHDGSIDWLIEANHLAPPGEDCGYKAFISTVDLMIMGRHSFEKVLSFNEWPYGNLPIIVLTSGSIDVPEHLEPFVSISNKKPHDLYQELEEKNFQHIYIDGGITIQQFLHAGLINEVTLTLIPILIGTGKRLFGDLDQDIELNHIATTSYLGGFVQIKYQINGHASITHVPN
ncbi:dihydrofolate reductase (plasmid) [Legionella adelaidensis]|uniref:Dihydrofolate reductase n=1 Tax=Legionella adelaidensis TaxID=45056 RepID=A0A0W0R1S9_9GAMM|nr:dihydrofolate reductase family protein [Legionella adelaidensis]KTC64958.1 dihydrofolate reductase [Legionella adelaidensis]VEH85467.1 dihydrofolate reductase [Legionella adelaidensis]